MPHKEEIPLDEAEAETGGEDAEEVPVKRPKKNRTAANLSLTRKPKKCFVKKKNARQKVLDEFRKQQEAIHEAQTDDKVERPATRPNKGPKEYMDDMAPAILVGSFVHDLSKRRDRKLGRKIDEANQDIEQLKSDTADAIDASARRAEERQTMRSEGRIRRHKDGDELQQDTDSSVNEKNETH